MSQVKRPREPASALPSDAAVDAEMQDLLRDWRTPKHLSEALVVSIIQRAAMVFLSEQMLVQVDAPVNICGDLHGQLHDLSTIFSTLGQPPAQPYLFLGDYVDRGKYGIETIIVLLWHKIRHPTKIYLLRGNHESASLTKQYGFYDDCKRKYSVRMWKLFVELFNCLPAAGLVEDSALCMHGGISPDLKSLDDINKIARPTDVGDAGLLCDLLWSDPESSIDGWGKNDRGVSCVFGEKALKDKLRELDLDMIIRAHQVMDHGYEFFAGRALVTVFSASNYCGEFTNCGAVLKMDENLKCSFQIFKPKFGV
jgi:diadenosine tetraphosphatase ApaH/serine/threonine PP2A family protein phosphatase